MKIKKAIIPVAGMGTRFLPATKAQPKEMLTLVDKPVIQYIVEEAVASGIEEIIFVTSQSKRAIEDHFDHNFELEERLRGKGKQRELEMILGISDMAKFAFVRQKEARGNGHAILQALPFLERHEPVAVLFGDDVIDGPSPCLREMIEAYERFNAPIVAVMEVPERLVSSYGVIAGEQVDERNWKMTQIVEKPRAEEAPSRMAVVGRYILTPELLPLVGNTKPGKDGEIGLTDAIAEYMQGKGLSGDTHQTMYAHAFSGKRYDCGNKAQFLIANVEMGLKHPEIGADFREYLEKR